MVHDGLWWMDQRTAQALCGPWGDFEQPNWLVTRTVFHPKMPCYNELNNGYMLLLVAAERHSFCRACCIRSPVSGCSVWECGPDVSWELDRGTVQKLWHETKSRWLAQGCFGMQSSGMGIVGCFRALPHFVDSNCIRDRSDLFCSVETWHSCLCGWRRLSRTAWKWSLIWFDPFVSCSFSHQTWRAAGPGGSVCSHVDQTAKEPQPSTRHRHWELSDQPRLISTHHTPLAQLSIHSGYYLPCQISLFFRIQFPW